MPEIEQSGSYVRDITVERLRDRFPALREEHPAFEERLLNHFDDFWIPYRAVYGDEPGIEKRIWKLVRILAAGFSSRDGHLIDLDEHKSSSPRWYQDQGTIGMTMYVDLFASNLKNLGRRVDYLRELGISYLHLMPLMTTRNGHDDGGFAVSDYRKVKPSLGTIKQLRTLVRELHQEGISVALDLVMNHTSCEHKWARKAAKRSKKYQAYYFMFEDRTMPDAYERSVPDVHSTTHGIFSWMPVAKKWVWTTFHDFQWDLNYANPAVFEAMLGEMVYLANLGADVLRLDGVPFIWKREGTDCRNQPETVLLVAAYRALMQMFAPAIAFKADTVGEPGEIGRYAGVKSFSGRAGDIAYNHTLTSHLWHALACENVQLLRSTLLSEPETPEQATRVNYVRSHDPVAWSISDEQAAAVGQSGHDTRKFCTDFYAGQRAGSSSEGYRFRADPHSGEARISGTAAALAGLQRALIEGDGGRSDLAIQRLLLLNGVIFFMRGFPMLYSGDEIGQLNDYTYLSDPDKRADNRWVHRPSMNWRKAEHRDVEDSVGGRLFQGIRKLVRARRNTPLLNGEIQQEIIPVASDSVLVVRRHQDDDEILMLANFSRHKQKIELDDLPATWLSGRYQDQIEGSTIDYSHGGQVVLAPYECLWIGHAENGPSDEVVAVDLSLRVETSPGELVYLSGNIPQLGEWSTDRAFGPLDASEYPIWKGTIMAHPGTVFEFVWLKRRERDVVEIETASRVHRVNGNGRSDR